MPMIIAAESLPVFARRHKKSLLKICKYQRFHAAFVLLAVILTRLGHTLYKGKVQMDIIVSAFAVIVALGCFIAIILATRKDKNKQEKKPSKD
jgi:prolipoprotein diacylglyceryltransferase